MQVNQGKTNPNTAGILSNGGVDPLKRKSTGCQDEDSINEVVYAAQVKANFFQDQEFFRLFTFIEMAVGPSINYVGSLRGRGSANHQFLPIMPNMFAYEEGEGGQKFEKSCLRSLWTIP